MEISTECKLDQHEVRGDIVNIKKTEIERIEMTEIKDIEIEIEVIKIMME